VFKKSFRPRDRPNQLDEEQKQGDMNMTGTLQKPSVEKVQRSKEEQQIIDVVEKSKGRKLTEQEINLALDQARSIGEL
jgi:hypothetical protein